MVGSISFTGEGVALFTGIDEDDFGACVGTFVRTAGAGLHIEKKKQEKMNSQEVIK